MIKRDDFNLTQLKIRTNINAELRIIIGKAGNEQKFKLQCQYL